MRWKTLPQAERDEWEAKAVAAQAERRKRYPDWRFRPATAAVAKLKSKDASARSRSVVSTARRIHPTVAEKCHSWGCPSFPLTMGEV
jgi:hypothetical protein